MTRSTAGGLSSRVRQRKLNLRTSLQVVKEDQTGTEVFDDVDNQKSVPRVETGVEKAEEVVCLLFFLTIVLLSQSVKTLFWQTLGDNRNAELS